MKVAVTGSSGLIGPELVRSLRADGHEVLRLVRRTPRTADEHRWEPAHHRIEQPRLVDHHHSPVSGCHAVNGVLA